MRQKSFKFKLSNGLKATLYLFDDVRVQSVALTCNNYPPIKRYYPHGLPTHPANKEHYAAIKRSLKYLFNPHWPPTHPANENAQLYYIIAIEVENSLIYLIYCHQSSIRKEIANLSRNVNAVWNNTVLLAYANSCHEMYSKTAKMLKQSITDKTSPNITTLLKPQN